MPFNLWKKPSFEEKLATLQSELRYFDPLIGYWPIKINDKGDLYDIRDRWDEAAKLADSLFKAKPESIEVRLACGNLLRMGHNIDVQRAGQACINFFGDVLIQQPENYAAHFGLACFYISANTELASKAEEHFLKASNLSAPNVDPLIYQGLGFACFYQNRLQEGIEYFEKYLATVRDARIRELVERLKAGESFKTVFIDLKT